MQFLLTKEEMDEYWYDRESIAKLPGKSVEKHMKMLGEVCKTIATTMVPLEPFNQYMVGKPYGCIHVNRRESYGYCDHCPVKEICPLTKDWSK